MNFTKLAALVAFMVGSSQIAYAIDLTPNMSLDTEVKMEHQVDAEATTITLEPEFTYTFGLADFTVGTTLEVWDNTNRLTFGDQFDSIPVMDFGVSYPLQENLEIEAGTSYNFEDDERGDITLRATFSF